MQLGPSKSFELPDGGVMTLTFGPGEEGERILKTQIIRGDGEIYVRYADIEGNEVHADF
jgi:hypothetical protein